jgi:hypothetical protein
MILRPETKALLVIWCASNNKNYLPGGFQQDEGLTEVFRIIIDLIPPYLMIDSCIHVESNQHKSQVMAELFSPKP